MNSFNEQHQLQSNKQQLITGADDPLLPNLVHAINNATEIEITVSFIQPSGLALLFDPLNEALQSGATLKLLTSDYLDTTHPNALRELMVLVDRGADVRIYQTQSNQSFHMKSYIFVKKMTPAKLRLVVPLSAQVTLAPAHLLKVMSGILDMITCSQKQAKQRSNF